MYWRSPLAGSALASNNESNDKKAIMNKGAKSRYDGATNWPETCIFYIFSNAGF